MYDLVVLNGLIVSGIENEKAFIGDIGINNKKISFISNANGSNRLKKNDGKDVVDATGNVICPGFIDVHTHLDAQITWDQYVTPISQNGVTTVITGNCGVGFAPCKKEDQAFLLALMEGVEDIPMGSMEAGVQFNWETFPEFLDFIASRNYTIDIGTFVPHGPVRAYVMGRRANEPDKANGPTVSPITDKEIELVAKTVGESIKAGAFGFSTSRTIAHRDRYGVLVPGTLAPQKELLAIGEAIANNGGGVFEMASDFFTYDDTPHTDENHASRLRKFGREWIWIQELSKGYGLKLNYCLGMPNQEVVPSKGFRNMLRKTTQANDLGCNVKSQVFTRPQGILMCWNARTHPFTESATFSKLWQECRDENNQFIVEKLFDENIKKQIVKEIDELSTASENEGFLGMTLPQTTDDGSAGNMNNMATNTPGSLSRMYLDGCKNIFRFDNTYEPKYEQSIEYQARRENKSPFEVLYDWMCEQNGTRVIYYLFMNYSTQNLDDTLEMLLYKDTIPGLGDSGAHYGFICDPSSHCYLLSHLHRDRKLISIETAVALHTSRIAEAFDLVDRGSIKLNNVADLNIIDLNKLKILTPEFVHDLPKNAGRWIQNVEGINYTIKSGTITFINSKPTGDLPGSLIRHKKDEKLINKQYPYATLAGKSKMFMHKLMWEGEQAALSFLIGIAGPVRVEQLGHFLSRTPLESKL